MATRSAPSSVGKLAIVCATVQSFCVIAPTHGTLVDDILVIAPMHGATVPTSGPPLSDAVTAGVLVVPVVDSFVSTTFEAVVSDLALDIAAGGMSELRPAVGVPDPDPARQRPIEPGKPYDSGRDSRSQLCRSC